jgi:hypothetical protein
VSQEPSEQRVPRYFNGDAVIRNAKQLRMCIRQNAAAGAVQQDESCHLPNVADAHEPPGESATSMNDDLAGGNGGELR